MNKFFHRCLRDVANDPKPGDTLQKSIVQQGKLRKHTREVVSVDGDEITYVTIEKKGPVTKKCGTIAWSSWCCNSTIIKVSDQ